MKFLKRKKKKNNISETSTKFFLARMKANVSEEYCWTITQGVGWSHCSWSGSNMLEVLILTGLPCIYVHSCLYVHSISTCTKLDLYWTFWNVTTSSRGSACTHMYWQSFLLSALWLCFAASVLPSLSSLLYK